MGTNTPSDETFEKWSKDIFRYKEEIKELNINELKQLKVYLRFYMMNIRTKLISKILSHDKIENYENELSFFTDYLYRKSYEIITVELKGEDKDFKEIEISELTVLKGRDIYELCDYFTKEVESPLPMLFMYYLNDETISELYEKDDDHRIVLERVNNRLLELESEIKTDLEVNTVQEPKITINNVYTFIFIAIRYLSIELDLNLGTYKTSKEAGEKISEKLIDKLPLAKNWSRTNLEKYISLFYGKTIHNRKVYIWEVPKDETTFSKRFRKLHSLDQKEVNEITNLLKTQIQTD